MSSINVVVCIYKSDIQETKKKIVFFFRTFKFNIDVLLCCTGDQTISSTVDKKVNLSESRVSFTTISVSNSLMDIGAYISGYKVIQNTGNLTIFMNDRFLNDLNTNLFSQYLFKDLSTLISIKSPLLYGNISYHGGLTQSSTDSGINYFIPTYLFVTNPKSDELLKNWAHEIKKIEPMTLDQLEFFLFQKYSRNLYNLAFEICMNKSSKFLWPNNKKYNASEKSLQKKLKCVVAEQLLVETFSKNALIFALNSTFVRKIMVRAFLRKMWFKW